MEQRDFVLKEIEKISVLILGLLGKLKRITNRKLFENEMAMLDGELSEAIGFSVDDIISFSEDELENALDNQRGFDESNLEALSDLLVLFAGNLEIDRQTELLSRALFILQYIDADSRTFSFERSMKISELTNRI